MLLCRLTDVEDGGAVSDRLVVGGVGLAHGHDGLAGQGADLQTVGGPILLIYFAIFSMHVYTHTQFKIKTETILYKLFY